MPTNQNTNNQKKFNISISIFKNNIFATAYALEAKKADSQKNLQTLTISSGMLPAKFKGRKKKVSDVAAASLGQELSTKLKLRKCEKVDIYFFGDQKSIKKAIVMELWKSGLTITRITEIDRTPHNGCRLKKKKRV